MERLRKKKKCITKKFCVNLEAGEDMSLYSTSLYSTLYTVVTGVYSTVLFIPVMFCSVLCLSVVLDCT